ncbi:MAG: bifunctional chorismate mutase/prephenate dehydrogenase [Methanobacteriota archaeon]|nr:MAG: bifunctional chorismate mutase/prephenate dehydrogenase [Euryarchaeota archaeon]
MVGRRLETAQEIGRTKRKDNLGIRDSSREELVVRSAAAKAAEAGVDRRTASAIMETLIDAAVHTQDEQAELPLDGSSALVVGAGKMGAWASRFLSNRGASVSVFDPRAELEGYPNVESPEEVAREADLIVIASPLGTADSDMKLIMSSSPSGVIFDLCSVKTHLRKTLLEAVSKGFKVTSVHPMFGPSTPTLTGRNILVCSCGCAEADESARHLFEQSGAEVVEVALDEHDELIAYILGAPHLCALLFGLVVARSSYPIEVLNPIQGPSFSKLAELADGIAGESRRVYHDIQRLNPQSASVLDSMAAIIDMLREASLGDDPAAFAEMMDEEREYFRRWSK